MYGVGCCRAGAHRESPLDEPGAKETVVIEFVSSKLNSRWTCLGLYCTVSLVVGNYAVTCRHVAWDKWICFVPVHISCLDNSVRNKSCALCRLLNNSDPHGAVDIYLFSFLKSLPFFISLIDRKWPVQFHGLLWFPWTFRNLASAAQWPYNKPSGLAPAKVQRCPCSRASWSNDTDGPEKHLSSEGFHIRQAGKNMGYYWWRHQDQVGSLFRTANVVIGPSGFSMLNLFGPAGIG